MGNESTWDSNNIASASATVKQNIDTCSVNHG